MFMLCCGVDFLCRCWLGTCSLFHLLGLIRWMSTAGVMLCTWPAAGTSVLAECRASVFQCLAASHHGQGIAFLSRTSLSVLRRQI